MSCDILIGSSNQGKIAEIKSILLLATNLSLVTPSQIGLNYPNISETGKTYHENALIKCQTLVSLTNMPCLTEDSGLEVRALDNQPGVKSARYTAGSDQDRCQTLLAKLGSNSDRFAQFVNVTCFIRGPKDPPRFFVGKLVGTIAQQPIGDSGFGYDSIFIPIGTDLTLAQLGQSVKNKLSARHNALTQFIDYAQTFKL